MTARPPWFGGALEAGDEVLDRDEPKALEALDVGTIGSLEVVLTVGALHRGKLLRARTSR
jgi:hypothetical protein